MSKPHPADTDPPPPAPPATAKTHPSRKPPRAAGARPPADPAATAQRNATPVPPPDDAPPAGRPVRRARDPQARRDALAAAAVEVIAESGIGRTTHRAVAAVAGLPLGATTYYFPTLDALIAAGLQRAAEAQEADLRRWAERIGEAPDLAAALVALTEEYLTDRRRARIEYELCVAAARDEALRPLAASWQEGFHELLAPRVGSAAARNISALLDGAMLQVLVMGTKLDAPALTDAVRRLAEPATGKHKVRD